MTGKQEKVINPTSYQRKPNRNNTELSHLPDSWNKILKGS